MQDAALDFENREEVNIASILTMSGLSKDEAADCANFPRLCEKCGLVGAICSFCSRSEFAIPSRYGNFLSCYILLRSDHVYPVSCSCTELFHPPEITSHACDDELETILPQTQMRIL